MAVPLDAKLPASIICNLPTLISDAGFYSTALYRNQLLFNYSDYLNGVRRVSYVTYLHTTYADRSHTWLKLAPGYDTITFQAFPCKHETQIKRIETRFALKAAARRG